MKTQKFRAAAILAGFLSFSMPAFAGDYTIANYDIKGSRAIPVQDERTLTKSNIVKKGLEVKFFTHTDAPIPGVPVVYEGVVYAGTTNFSSGSLYAIDATTGAVKYQIPMPGGVLASPLIHKGKLYVASLNGTLYKINPKTGSILWQRTATLSPLDSIWTGPIAIPRDGGDGKDKDKKDWKDNNHWNGHNDWKDNDDRDLIILAVNPQDEFPGAPLGIAGVLAFDAKTGDEIWRTVITEPGEGGSGIWGASPSYSADLDLIFVSTGQTTYANNLMGTSNTSDAVYALSAKDGKIKWKNQVRQDDVWNFNDYFFPELPKDTDVADSPALFVGKDGKEYVAMGSKRGYFYIMDAKKGNIINGSGTDSLGFKKGLDLFNYSGVGPVGNGLDGGFNLDSGYFKHHGKMIHFGILSDYKAGLQNVFNKAPPFVDGGCYVAGFGAPASLFCPPIDNGNLVLIDENGEKEVGRYTVSAAHLFSPIYLNNMIIASENSNESAVVADQTPNRVVILDVSDPTHPTLIHKVDLTFGSVTAVSGGAMISVGNGMIYAGNGFFGFGPQEGLFGIGLK